MNNNTSRTGQSAKERTGISRRTLSGAEWEYVNATRDIMGSPDNRSAHRRHTQFRGSLNRDSLTREKRVKRPGSASLLESGISIRVDTEALLESVRFNKGSIEDFLSIGLTGIMNKAEANLVAIELGRLINSAVYKHGLTIEERAVNGEIGRRLAEYFAYSYFEDTDEAKALMVLVNAFIEKNAMLEKGYYFWDGQAYEPYKPVPISIVYKLGDVHWSRATVEAFRNNEKVVGETINNAVASVDDETVSARLALIMAKLGMIKDTVDEDDIIHDIQWVLDLQHLYLS